MIVFALRHADRTAGDDLSTAGQERAELLARMLVESGINGAFARQRHCSPFWPASTAISVTLYNWKAKYGAWMCRTSKTGKRGTLPLQPRARLRR